MDSSFEANYNLRNRMNPKTLQYLMGHADIGTTLNVV